MSQKIISNLENGTLIMFDKFDANAVNAINSTPYLNSIGSEYIISFTNLQKKSFENTFKASFTS